jgi:hypothetical protein
MSRLSTYFGIVAALILGVIVASIPSVTSITTESESSYLSTFPAITIITSEQENWSGTTTEKESSVIAVNSQKVAPEKPNVAAPIATSNVEKEVSFDDAAAALRAALVNIICYASPGTRLHSISGSGVIVNPNGIILTNAHIAQYFLLASRNVSCVIRAGSPATDAYEASPIYIPTQWIEANANVLTEQNPSGTGEYDFALLAVSKTASRKALPNTFPFIPLAISPPNNGTPVVIGTYGAQFLESSQVQSSLFPTMVFGKVKDIFTFASTTIDVISLGGSAAAQEGSSGGGVANSYGDLIGTITTSTIKGTTDTRTLSAITVSYIRAAYASETGSALDILLSKPTATLIADFAPQISALESILTMQFN